MQLGFYSSALLEKVHCTAVPVGPVAIGWDCVGLVDTNRYLILYNCTCRILKKQVWSIFIIDRQVDHNVVKAFGKSTFWADGPVTTLNVQRVGAQVHSTWFGQELTMPTNSLSLSLFLSLSLSFSCTLCTSTLMWRGGYWAQGVLLFELVSRCDRSIAFFTFCCWSRRACEEVRRQMWELLQGCWRSDSRAPWQKQIHVAK